MGVSSDNGIWVQDAILFEDDARKPLKVDLMDDTIAWWNDTEVGEGRFAPLEERKPLLVPVELDLFVLVLGICSASDIDLDRVIDDEVSLAKWVDLVRVATELLHGSAHGSQVNDGWDTCEVLKEYTGGLERNLEILLR